MAAPFFFFRRRLSFAILANCVCVGIVVVDEPFLVGIPGEFAACPPGDVAQVAEHRGMMADLDVRGRALPCPDAV